MVSNGSCVEGGSGPTVSLPGIETLIGGVTTGEGGLKRTGHTAQRICEVNMYSNYKFFIH